MSGGRTAAAAVPVRSARGLLLTVLLVSAAVALGLGAVRSPHPPQHIGGLRDVAWLLSGWRLALAVLALGGVIWAGGAVLEAVVGIRATRVAAVLLALTSPVLGYAATGAYWQAREYRSVWRADGLSPDTPSGLWRGMLGGGCGYGSLIEVRVDASGRGRGVRVPAYLGASGVTALLAFGTLDGPLAEPVDVEVRDGEMTVWVEDWGAIAADVVEP